MPRFDYRCTKCDEDVLDVLVRGVEEPLVRCPKCGLAMEKNFATILARPRVFQPYWEHNLGPEPVFIDSRETLKQEAKRRQLTPAGG